jgi:hypothetical protein
MTAHSSGHVRDGLARCFLRNGVERPQLMADLAEPVVRLVLEERDRELAAARAEIELLQARLSALEEGA